MSDTWISFTSFTVLDEKTTSRPDTLWAEIWKDMSDASKIAKKSKSGLLKNRSSTMRENCVVFTAVVQMMKNSKIS